MKSVSWFIDRDAFGLQAMNRFLHTNVEILDPQADAVHAAPSKCLDMLEGEISRVDFNTYARMKQSTSEASMPSETHRESSASRTFLMISLGLYGLSMNPLTPPFRISDLRLGSR